MTPEAHHTAARREHAVADSLRADAARCHNPLDAAYFLGKAAEHYRDAAWHTAIAHSLEDATRNARTETTTAEAETAGNPGAPARHPHAA